MDFLDLVKKRYSVRAYRTHPVEEEKLMFILDAARLAPTAGNRQPFHIIIIHTEGRQNELKKIYAKDFFVQAPIIICLCTVHGKAWTRKDGKNYSDIDAAIVMDHMVLAATEKGLGSCWIVNFDQEEARKILGLPDDEEPVAFTPLGYPADNPPEKKRKSLADIVLYERWQNKN